jgi:Protein of unknown function (DUF3761)
MRVARFVPALCALAVVLPVAAGAGAAPPGATARCRDGTYSYSRHRSGTCSHHGGVAVWLTPAAGGTRVVGRTVLLGPRTRTLGCRLGAEPDRRCSPGAVYTRLTRSVLCARGFRTGSIRNVPQGEKFAVEHEYGLAERYYGRTLEIDHIVPLELGGSNVAANLFPERAGPAPGYRVKDRLENRLRALVCSGSMRLGAAQAGIARDWEALYTRVFGVRPTR